MKDIIHFNILFSLLLLLLSLTIQSYVPEINIIPDAYSNSTAGFAYLEGNEKEKYTYFSFDFEYHNKVNKDQKNMAYFKISTNSFISPAEIKYSLSDKKDFQYSDLKLIDESTWKPCFLLNKEKDLYGVDYYIQIYKFASDDKNNLAILRIPTFKYEGDITIENLFSYQK